MKNFRQTRLRIGVSAIGLFLASPALAQTPPSPAAEAPTTATPPSQPWAHERSDVPADPAVRYGLLANGLRYAILRNETPAGKASLWLRVDAGSLMERSEENTSELQSLMRISYAVFCLKKKTQETEK